jgi:hypothetical protein
MNSNRFVEIFQKLTVDGSVSSAMKVIAHPPGSAPAKTLVRLSQWFHALSDNDKNMVDYVARLSSGLAAMACLCILDGAQAIEAGPDKGHLELFYCKGDEKLLLNDRSQEPLNDKLTLTL